jgi:lipoprotein NlpI
MRPFLLLFTSLTFAITVVGCASPSAAEEAQDYYARGKRYLETRRYDDAVDAFRIALKADPSFAMAASGIGDALIMKKQFVEAIDAFDLAIRIDPDLSKSYFGRARALRDTAHYQEAIADYSRAIERNLGYGAAYHGRALAWLQLGQREHAVADFEAADRVDPQTNTRRQIALQRFYMGRFSESAEDFRRVAEWSLEGGYTSLWRFLARVRTGDDIASAQKELNHHRSLLRGDAWPLPVVDFYRGHMDSVAVREAAANAGGKKAIEQTCEADYYIAEWHLLRGDHTSARPLLERAVTTCPDTFIEHKGAVAELSRLKP